MARRCWPKSASAAITTKFIFMSGYAEDAFERNLENPDDFGFLQKPFSLKQLLEKVKDGHQLGF